MKFCLNSVITKLYLFVGWIVVVIVCIYPFHNTCKVSIYSILHLFSNAFEQCASKWDTFRTNETMNHEGETVFTSFWTMGGSFKQSAKWFEHSISAFGLDKLHFVKTNLTWNKQNDKSLKQCRYLIKQSLNHLNMSLKIK